MTTGPLPSQRVSRERHHAVRLAADEPDKAREELLATVVESLSDDYITDDAGTQGHGPMI